MIMTYELIKYLHFLGIFLVVGGLFAELWLVERKMSRGLIAKVARIDGTYGLGAMVTVSMGLILWLSDIGKPAEFYSAGGLVYWKLAVFTVIGLLSIYPTVFFAKNRKSSKNPMEEEELEVPSVIIWIIRLEFLLLLAIPFLAILMARGLSL